MVPPMDVLLRALGECIRTLRESRGLSVSALARRSGLSIRFVTELLAGRANVSVVNLARVGQALETSAAALLADAEAKVAKGDDRPTVIALLGIRGAGKSAVGARLADRLGVAFLELDHEVETEAGLSLAEIFALHGESYYRRLEVDALRRILSQGRGAVLAAGGGIVTNPPALQLLEERSLTVWLRASAKDHWSRVIRQGQPRPMTDLPGAKSELRRLIAAREPLYRRARVRVDTSRLGLEGSVQAILGRLGLDAPMSAERRSRRAASRNRARRSPAG
jgi:XRE family transcriptional regulator, aerobic/anaerobic benzoate catabolism transcriptional regulator